MGRAKKWLSVGISYNWYQAIFSLQSIKAISITLTSIFATVYRAIGSGKNSLDHWPLETNPASWLSAFHISYHPFQFIWSLFLSLSLSLAGWHGKHTLTASLSFFPLQTVFFVDTATTHLHIEILTVCKFRYLTVPS